MKIKHIILTLFISLFICACSSDIIDDSNNINNQSIPSTEVFVQGGIISNIESNDLYSFNTMTRSGIVGRTYNKWPYVSNEGWETARFSIRADGQIVDVSNQSSSLYFGRTPGKMGNNRGAVYTLYPYGRYNDRDLDYYQKDKKTGQNIGLFRYVHDENGINTLLAIEDAPKVVDILADEKYDLETAIANGQNVSKNQANLDKLNNMLSLGEEYLEKHVLWYVVKEVGMRYGWHVNGIISDKEIIKPEIDITKIPNNVEIDIHQQKHQDWSEIKTSIHIRTDVESVKINIPIKEDNILEQDDFNIRVYDYYYKEYIITHTISHNINGITIEINNIPGELIELLKNKFGDGLTVEIHSYCKREDEVWDDLKNSKVISLGKDCELTGQITSALKEGELVTITK